MQFKKILNKALACTVALTLFASAAVTPVPACAAECSDISNHWAEKYIQSAISKGFANGYADGTFKPNKEVTRAEFASMLNKALGNKSTTSISFNDVSASSWYYSDIAKAVAANYVSGYKDNSFRPNRSITREEAAAIISNVVPGYGSTGDIKEFGDYQSISNWALKALQKSISKGYIGAYEDGKIHPKDCLTRAQVAKIICDITDKESIVSSTAEIKSNDTTLSGKIYSNGVMIHKELGEGNATIDNCIIMGELGIQGGGSNSVIINNSRIAHCSVAKPNSSVRVVSKGETSILMTYVSDQAKLETANLTGGDNGLGFCQVKTRSSSNLSLVGDFPSIEVAGSNSEVKLESGKITTLDVGSDAKNSKITVENNGTIMTTNVNSTVSFRGNGTVQNMNANADGITYEKKPDRVNVGSGVTIKPSEIRDITFDPFDGEKNVPINKKITITFSEAMTKYDGKEILNSDLNNLIKLTKDSKSGTAIPFSADINSGKKVITITPTQSLNDAVNYYITIDKDVFKTQSGKGNVAQSSSFTVGAGTANNIIFNPVDGEQNVPINKKITITFSQAITDYNGRVLLNSDFNNLIKLTKDSKSGTSVPFSAEIDSTKKVITITPNQNLTANGKYCVSIEKDVFNNESKSGNAAQSICFTVGMGTANNIIFNPVDGEQNVPINKKITITFSQAITDYNGRVLLNSDFNNLIKLTKDSKVGTVVPFSAEIDSTKKVITITPNQNLTPNGKYYISIEKDVFNNESKSGNAAQSICFTVQSENANNVTFLPANGATGVKAKELTITFDSAIKAYSGEGITPNYLKNNIVFKKDSANGANVNFKVTINRNANCITIIPESKLSNGQKYYLGFGSSIFATSLNTNPIAGQSVTWNTGDTTTPTISLHPRDGLTGVSTVESVGATFSERVFDSSGSIPNQSYISTMVRLKDNTLGYYVSCTKHFIDESQSRIYIDLPEGLTSGHNYTFTVDGMYFKNEDGNYATAASTTFTVIGSLDISGINAAISRANSAKANVVESENGKDVADTIYWVNSAQMNTLNNAITTANQAIKNVRTTAEARTVASSLDSATTAFERSKKLGLKGTEVVDPKPIDPKPEDISSLDQSIAFANLVKKNVVISKDGTDVLPTQQWVTIEMMNALNEVLAKATKAKTTVKTEEEAIRITVEQNWQIARYFDMEKKYGTKENTNNNHLAAALNAAQSLKNDTLASENGQDIPTDQYWVPYNVIYQFVYDDTYYAHKMLLNKSATQEDIDNAEAAIKAATEDFAKKRQLGTKAD